MASSVNLGYPLWMDGQTWTSLLQRQFGGGAAVWDANTSATAVNPLGGVFPGPGSPLSVQPLAIPAMSVLANAGYCAIPHPTQGHGVYLFGLESQATLTVAANGSGAIRIDIVIARVRDNGDNTSSCDVEIITGTPGSGQPATPGVSILLGVISVASGTSSITSAAITGTRTFTVAPGGILPATAITAPPLAQGQLIWNTGTGALETLAPAQTFTQTIHTTTNWVSPITGLVYAEGTGGDGGGGGGYQDFGGAAHTTQGGAGAGGAEYAAQWIAVTQGHSYPVTIGQGGFRGDGASNSGGGGTKGGNGADGTATTFPGDTQTLTANGGKGGQGGGTNFPNAGGQGGTGSPNAVHQPGGTGGSGSQASSAAGGGGGGAGSAGAPGGAGQNASGSRPGAGGVAGPGAGTGGSGGSSSHNGSPGNAPGGAAGGGGADDDTHWQAGGDGSDGQLTLTWVLRPATLTPLVTADSEISSVGTSTGTSGSSGLTPASGSAFGWGIGYGSTSRGTDGSVVPQIQLTFSADGKTDFAIDAKWGLAVPEAAVDSTSPSITRGQCRIVVLIDNTVIDQVYLNCSATGGVTHPGDGGSFTVYTSMQRGTTPSAGTHTATLAVATANTLSGQLSGAHIGNLASVGKSTHPFGGALPSPYTAGLTQENCSLRIAGLLASTL